MGERLQRAAAAVGESDVDGWLLYDFRHSNPLLWELTETSLHSTRRVYLWLPRDGEPVALVHHVDAAHFASWGIRVQSYRDRDDLLLHVRELLPAGGRVAMEYSPMAVLPTLSWVDGGTLDLVRSFGVEVVSSGNLAQTVLSRMTGWQLASHRYAARKLTEIVRDAFGWIGEKVTDGIGENDVAEFIRLRFMQEALWTDEGPIVAVNAHAGDPHYEPTRESSLPIRPGDWVLIDLWAKQEGGIFGDITWTGYVGREVPDDYLKVYQTVNVARDMALDYIRFIRGQGRYPQGWEVDKVARDYITSVGYGEQFTHRLGHSLGTVVHGYGANLDSFETQDTRELIPGTAFTIEPGIYLPHFGVRSEINVYMRENGPEPTTEIQQQPVLIKVR